MKIIISILLSFLLLFSGISSAGLVDFLLGGGGGGSWESPPSGIIKNMKSDIQKTALDDSIGGNGQGVGKTLSDIKRGSNGYIQWMGYIGLSLALILIIYNGILLLANFGEEDKLSKVKKKMASLVLGVILLSGAAVFIAVIVGIIGGVFK